MIPNRNSYVEKVIVEIKDYINLLKSREDVFACYYQGSMEEFIPNVSDVDLIIITKDNFNTKNIFLRNPNIDLSLYPECIWKRGIYIKPLFKSYIFPFFEKKHYLNNIWNIPVEKLKLVYLSHIIDYSYCTFFSWLNKYATKILNRENLSVLDIKELLKRINGLKYLVMMYNYVFHNHFKKEPYEKFFAEVKQLRKKETIGQEELMEVTEYSYNDILFPIIRDVVNYLKNDRIVNVSLNNNVDVTVCYISGRNFIIYLPSEFFPREAKEWLNTIIRLHKGFRSNILLLPLEFALNLDFYSKFKVGLIQNKIKKYFLNKNVIFNVSKDYSEVLIEKYYVLNEWAKYIKNNKISIGFRPFEYRYANTIKDKGIEFYFYIKHLYQRIIPCKIREMLCKEVLK